MDYKKILAGLGIFIGMILLVSAIELTTRYNPWTGKLDYISSGDFSGSNVTGDFYFGDGIDISHFKIDTINITCFDSACNWYTNATDSCMYWPSGGKDCGA